MLIDLPTEVIYGILGQVLPEDLENFAQTCRRIALIAGLLLKDHRSLVRKYALCSNHHYCSEEAVALFAEKVAAEPRLGYYLTRMKYKTRDDLHVPFLKLLQLPNLNYLTIEGERPPPDNLVEVIEAANRNDPPGLTKLRKVSSELRSMYTKCAVIQAFSALPSLRSLSVKGWVSPWDDETGHFDSRVASLELLSCSLHSQVLSKILRGFVELQTFTYSHCLTRIAEEDILDGFQIQESLLQNKATLRELVLLLPNRQSSPFRSLLDFEALEVLESDWRLLPASTSDDLELCFNLPRTLRVLKVHNEDERNTTENLRRVELAISRQISPEARLQYITLVFSEELWKEMFGSLNNSAAQDLRQRCYSLQIVLTNDYDEGEP